MEFLPFVQSHHDLNEAYVGYHVPWLVVLSLTMAILAAFTSLSHTDLIRRTKHVLARRAWHVSGALAMGLGIWSMHFIGMISFRIDVPVYYDTSLTAISVLPAFFAAWITLHVLSKNEQSVKSILIGGLLLGAGIGAMHYTGMAAIETTADMRYQPFYFLLSILVAVVLASLALATRRWLRGYIENQFLELTVASIVMGLAVASMHYVAMHATVFLPGESDPFFEFSGVAPEQLVIGTLFVASFIVVLNTVVVLMQNQTRHLRATVERRGELVQELTKRLRTVAARVPGMVYQLRRDAKGRLHFTYLSEAVNSLFCVTAHEAVEDASEILRQVPESDRIKLFESLEHSAKELEPWQHEFRVVRGDGEQRWLYATAVAQAEPHGVVSWSGFITDVTEKKQSAEMIHRLAYYDALTNLPNRRWVVDELNDRISRCAAQRKCVLVWLINLDNFKRINDVHGQPAGDALLKAVAEALTQLVEKDMVLVRLTADEFLLVHEKSRDEDIDLHARAISAKILNVMSQQFNLPRLRHQGSASVGVATAFDSSVTADELMRRADLAVAHAKRSGGNHWSYYDPSIEVEVSARFQLELDLRAALHQNEFVLFYQLQVSENGQPFGVEALMRWQHPTRGLVSPAEFIPMAEESGLIVPMGAWALEEACRQLAIWQTNDATKHLSVSVNVSARQFYQHDFTEFVLNTIQAAGVPAKLLKLELTETLVLEDLDVVVRKMRALKEAGVRFSMDDFGTGYSSLSYLSTLPFDEVKIDQAFIRRASSLEHERDWTIVEAIIGIARNLGMEVIAEGVETEVQWQRLADSGCLRYQGYLFSKPVSISELPV
ncbi:MAG: EAL domain-containing protein [Idiomarina sp.]|nr:EAL domain-containing protein [Idiomarina sp.]